MENQNDLEPRKKTPNPLALAMYARGVRHRDVAAACDCNPSTVCNVLAGRDSSARVVVALAKMIGKSERWVFEQINAIRPSRRPRQPRRPAQPDVRPAAVQQCDAALESAEEE